MSDLSIRCERHSEPLSPIFPRTLGPAFATLPDVIRATHLTAATTQGETWTRRFGSRTFRSYLKSTPQGMTERFGPSPLRLA